MTGETSDASEGEQSSQMKVEVTRSGGLFGADRGGAIDLSTLSPDDAAEVRTALAELGEGSKRDEDASTPAKPDRFHYRIVTREAGRDCEISVDEDELTDTQSRAVETLFRLAVRSSQQGRGSADQSRGTEPGGGVEVE